MAKGKFNSKKISEETLSNDEAQKLVDSKEAVIPQEAIINQDLEKNDYQNHPKFSKFNQVGGQ